MNTCIFSCEEQDGHATIKACKLRDDDNVYPSNPPDCKRCKDFASVADVKQALRLFRNLTHCGDVFQKDEDE